MLHEHEECSTLPRFLPKLGEKGLQHMDFKLAGGEEGMKKAKILVETGIASPHRRARPRAGDPAHRRARLVPAASAPKEEIAKLAAEGRIVDEGAYIIELFASAKASRPPRRSTSSRRTSSRSPSIIPGANRISYGTSTPAAIYAGYLLDGTIDAARRAAARGA